MTNVIYLNNELTEEIVYKIQMFMDEIAMATNNEIEESINDLMNKFNDVDMICDYLEEKYL